MKRLQQHFFSNDCIFCDLRYIDIRYILLKTLLPILYFWIQIFFCYCWKDQWTTKRGGGGILYKVGIGLTIAFCSALKIRLLGLTQEAKFSKKLKPEAYWLLPSKCKFDGQNSSRYSKFFNINLILLLNSKISTYSDVCNFFISSPL